MERHNVQSEVRGSGWTHFKGSGTSDQFVLMSSLVTLELLENDENQGSC